MILQKKRAGSSPALGTHRKVSSTLASAVTAVTVAPVISTIAAISVAELQRDARAAIPAVVVSATLAVAA